MYLHGPTEGRKRHVSMKWKLWRMEMSRTVVAFFSQIIMLYICILTCFVNLSVKNGPPELWISLLSLSLGRILPSPKVKKRLSVDINSPPPSLPDSLAWDIMPCRCHRGPQWMRHKRWGQRPVAQAVPAWENIWKKFILILLILPVSKVPTHCIK